MIRTQAGTHPRSARAQGLDTDPLWYKDAIIYEVRTRSFYDSNGDGIGDLQGLTSKLDYLADLGITALWLLPHYPSPGRDDGYDIAEYTDVHPDVGTMADFDEFVAQAHKRGIRVITELVLNHTSDQHPWFQRARRAAPGSPERDYYVWNDSADRYKDARIIFRGFETSNWTWDPVANAYFWHRFYSHQPDLNFENPAVHEAMLAVVDFWFERGVDGLRLDAVPYLYESEGTNCENLQPTHAFLKKLRAHVDAKFQGRMLLAEANQWPEDAARYFGDGDECHMNFHFPIMPRLFMAIHMEDRFPIIDILQQTPELHPTCQWAMFLRNHDELTLEMVTDEERDYMYRAYANEAPMRINLGIRRRLAPLTGNDRRKMELLDGLLFSMPGTPVLYYGDEIGMGDNVYLGDRNGVRTPMQWSADRNAGFSRANPQRLILPIIIDPEYHYEAINVEAQQSNAHSRLWWTKRLIALRKRFQAFGRGSVQFLQPSNPRVLAFVRRWSPAESQREEVVLVVANLSRHVQYVELDLSAMKGMVPTELTGGARFPAIGDAPYLLTVAGHGFYWFSLGVPRSAQREEARRSDYGSPHLAVSSATELLHGRDRAALNEILPAILDLRGLASAPVTQARIVDSVQLGPPGSAMALLLVRADYVEGEPVTFAISVMVQDTEANTAPVLATLSLGDAPETRAVLVEATAELVGKSVHDAIVGKSVVRSAEGIVRGMSFRDGSRDAPREVRVLATDRIGSTLAMDGTAVLKLPYRIEDGTAPEVELGRFVAERAPGLTPSILGVLEHDTRRREPMTLGVLEEYVVHEGTAWQQARGDLGRSLERVLAQPTENQAANPKVPTDPLLRLASLVPPEEHREVTATYREWATRLGRRTAELHLAVAASTSAAFEPQGYGAMDQRSKYQTARNRAGRVLAALRQSLGLLPADARSIAERVLGNEHAVMERFAPLLGGRIDALRIRIHGDLHLGRALFTGKDYVLLLVGASGDKAPAERRRKRSALYDVASMIRSFHYAAATTIRALRPEDQARGEAWGWIWQRWAAAAFVQGYLKTADQAAFLPKNEAMLSMLLEAAILEKAFTELQSELRRRPDMAWIPLQGILRLLEVESRTDGRPTIS